MRNTQKKGKEGRNMGRNKMRRIEKRGGRGGIKGERGHWNIVQKVSRYKIQNFIMRLSLVLEHFFSNIPIFSKFVKNLSSALLGTFHLCEILFSKMIYLLHATLSSLDNPLMPS